MRVKKKKQLFETFLELEEKYPFLGSVLVLSKAIQVCGYKPEEEEIEEMFMRRVPQSDYEIEAEDFEFLCRTEKGFKLKYCSLRKYNNTMRKDLLEFLKSQIKK